MNREEKRLMQRQGQIGADGQPVAPSRPQARQPSVQRRTAPRGTPLSYFRDVRNELRKVSWPTRAEIRSYSMVVFITVAVLMALVSGLDYGFSQAAVFLFK